MRRSFILAAAAVVSAVLVAGALAAKPPNGSRTGVGTVFLPNPVAELQDQSLTDQKDADYAALAPAYHDVVLTNLDGSGCLCGDWACIRAETSTPAYSPTNTFQFRRDDERFEQVMAYYWVTQAQLYLQSLGFGDDAAADQPRVAGHPGEPARDRQLVLVGQARHPALRQGRRRRRRGRRGDPPRVRPRHAGLAADAVRVRLHAEAGAIGEGFADYFAGTVSTHYAPTPDPACIADWDSVSYTAGRRTACGASTRRCTTRRTSTWCGSTAPAGSGRRRCGRSARRSARRRPTGSSSRPRSATARARRCRRLRPRRSSVAGDLYGPGTAAVVEQKFADRGLA